MTTFRGSNSGLRSRVYQRDAGFCALCGLDTDALTARYREAEERDREDSKGTVRCLNAGCEHVGNARPCEACGSRFQQTVDSYTHRGAVVNEAKRHGFKPVEFINLMRATRSLWIADHVLPVADGGDPYDINNARTLCVACEKGVTSDQAKERGKRRAKARSPRNIARAIVRAARGIR